MSASWSSNTIPDLSEHHYVVTGGNAGLGFFASVGLTQAGARVILACRSSERAIAAKAAIQHKVPGARVDFVELDTSDLASVAHAAETLGAEERIDGIVANAGIVHPPAARTTSVDSNELVLATNFLGHFALIARLLPTLRRVPASRIVTLGSMASRLSSFQVDNLQLNTGYTSWRAYAQSKIAVQSFGFELDRRLRAAESTVSSIVVHPGYSISGLTRSVPRVNEPTRAKRFVASLQSSIAQSKERGEVGS